MAQSKTVLIVGTDAHSKLAEKLFRKGFILLFRKRMFQALRTLRQDKFDAIFIDAAHAEVDVLEFILNVRDIHQDIAIYLVGKPGNDAENRVILNQENTFLLDRLLRPVKTLSNPAVYNPKPLKGGMLNALWPKTEKTQDGNP